MGKTLYYNIKYHFKYWNSREYSTFVIIFLKHFMFKNLFSCHLGLWIIHDIFFPFAFKFTIRKSGYNQQIFTIRFYLLVLELEFEIMFNKLK